jgi:Asp-tRNA(Asn)/Glu-tRNA(Gln) amidotransferase A subunit family amidase
MVCPLASRYVQTSQDRRSYSYCFKDCFNIEGVPSTIGFASFIKNGPVKSSSALVEIIVALGGIPYVKTNIPQTMMVLNRSPESQYQ